jgi:potassium/chloride transporter 9
VLIGAQMFAKTSAFILGTVVVCLFSTFISFIVQGEKQVDVPPENQLINATNLTYTGLSMQTLRDNLYPNYGKDYTSGGNDVNFAMVFGE